MTKARNISLFFLVLAAVPILFILLNESGKWQIHSAMQHLLHSDKKKDSLRIQSSEVQWLDENEIMVGGRMFDIGKAELKNGWYLFIGHFDEKETALVKRQQQSTGKEPQSHKRLLQLFKNLQQQFFAIQQYCLSDQKAEISYPLVITTLIPPPFRNILTPPPQAFMS